MISLFVEYLYVAHDIGISLKTTKRQYFGSVHNLFLIKTNNLHQHFRKLLRVVY